MAVVDHDPDFWPEIARGDSLFVHKLAVKRFAAGRGVSDALLSYAKAMCVRRGILTLRLDTDATRPKVRAVYERNGFVFVEEKLLFGMYHTALYMCDAGGATPHP